MSIFNKTSKRLEKLIEEAVETSCHTASKMKTGLKGDYPVTIHCYRQAEYWDSAYLAYHFYLTGAMCCGGSEASRYMAIVSDLKEGKKVASDGDPVREMIMRVA